MDTVKLSRGVFGDSTDGTHKSHPPGGRSMASCSLVKGVPLGYGVREWDPSMVEAEGRLGDAVGPRHS